MKQHLLLPLALMSHYVRPNFKLPQLTWLWILNNLFFVCVAEEALFRGLIQGGLAKLLPPKKIWAFFAIGVAALLFGLAHFKGGPAYMILAAIAGLFYGYAFWKANRIEAPILVHFSLNLIHFLAFSYPALVTP